MLTARRLHRLRQRWRVSPHDPDEGALWVGLRYADYGGGRFFVFVYPLKGEEILVGFGRTIREAFRDADEWAWPE
jgi:flavin-dependent dehydrogenase